MAQIGIGGNEQENSKGREEDERHGEGSLVKGKWRKEKERSSKSDRNKKKWCLGDSVS